MQAAAAGRSPSISARRSTGSRCAPPWPQLPARGLPRGWTSRRVEETDWVRKSLAGLAPVAAGRFVVHGAHDRAARSAQPHRHRDRSGARLRHRPSRHHARLSARAGRALQVAGSQRGLRILDLGTGSGVLAIAAARALHRRVLATDIDASRGARRARQRPAQPRRRLVEVVAGERRRRAQVRAARAVRSRSSPTSCSGRCCGSPRRCARLTAPGARIVLSGVLPRRPMR